MFGNAGGGWPVNRLAIFGANICKPNQAAWLGAFAAHEFGLRNSPGAGVA
jgi:hypothetical protein